MLVIGGGIMGIAAAYWLSRSSLRVTVVEARRIGSGASGRNAGLMLAGASDLERSPLLLEALHREGIDPQYEQTGHLALAASPEMLERMQAELARRRPDAPRLQVLNRAECEDLLRTRLTDRLLGGRWYPGGAVVHPGRLIAGLACAAANYGARIFEGTSARAIRPVVGTDWLDVETSRGGLRARHVIVAAQVATGRLLPDLAPAFSPTRGQMLSTTPMRRIFHHAMAIDWGSVYWRQTRDGVVVLGGCAHVDPETERTRRDRLNPVIQAALSRVLLDAFPQLPPMTVARRWAGIMDHTLDGRPIVGGWPPNSNQWVIAGFGGHGLPPALGIAREVATAVMTGKPSASLEALDPARFAQARRRVPASVEGV